MRYRYFARSRPAMGPQVDSNARRAAATARSTSWVSAIAIRESGSSVAGSSVTNVCPPWGATSLPSMNRSYRSAMLTTSRDSGAGAYSQGIACPSPRAHVDGAVVPRPTSAERPGERTSAVAEGAPFGRGRFRSLPVMRDSVHRRWRVYAECRIQ